MEHLPLLIDVKEAIALFHQANQCSDALKAYIVAFLSREGLSNRDIRAALNIDKVYTLTHLKRVGLALSETEFALWHKNPSRITLGHLRAIAKLPVYERETMLRKLLARKMPVHHFESIAKGKSTQQDVDIKRYEELMGNALGRPINIRYNAARQSGSLSLDFFSLEDLDNLANTLGFNARDYL